MLKQIQQGFSKFFTMERVIVLAVFLVLAYGLIMYSGNKSFVVDRMTNYAATDKDELHSYNDLDSLTGGKIGHIENNTEEEEEPTNYPEFESFTNNGFSSHSVANPSDLLPKDQNSEWSALNPNTMNKGNTLMPDLLQAGYHIGLDTIGQTLRNANLQLRSDPIIPKASVGPWNQSTIEPDLGRVPLEIGDGAR
jgi:hypothetical protein